MAPNHWRAGIGEHIYREGPPSPTQHTAFDFQIPPQPSSSSTETYQPHCQYIQFCCCRPISAPPSPPAQHRWTAHPMVTAPPDFRIPRPHECRKGHCVHASPSPPESTTATSTATSAALPSTLIKIHVTRASATAMCNGESRDGWPFHAYQLSSSRTAKELLAALDARKLTQIHEHGNGVFGKGIEILRGDEKAKLTLEQLGWKGAGAALQHPVFVAVS
jgi:hypothetical protein